MTKQNPAQKKSQPMLGLVVSQQVRGRIHQTSGWQPRRVMIRIAQPLDQELETPPTLTMAQNGLNLKVSVALDVHSIWRRVQRILIQSRGRSEALESRHVDRLVNTNGGGGSPRCKRNREWPTLERGRQTWDTASWKDAAGPHQAPRESCSPKPGLPH